MAQSARRATRFLIRHSSLSRTGRGPIGVPAGLGRTGVFNGRDTIGASAAAGWKCRTPDLKSEGTFLSQEHDHPFLFAYINSELHKDKLLTRRYLLNRFCTLVNAEW